jgi:hypothetical protein
LGNFPLRIISTQLPKAVAFSVKRSGFDAKGKRAEDMKCGDYTEEQIKSVDWNFKVDDFARDMSSTSAQYYFYRFREMATELFSVGKLEKNINAMIDRFEANTGGVYSNSDLTESVREHDSTQRFFQTNS